jgi:hypothetical protein
MHASYRQRTFALFAILYGDNSATVNAPGNLVLVLAGGYAGITFDATFGITVKFHSSHFIIPPA